MLDSLDPRVDSSGAFLGFAVRRAAEQGGVSTNS